MSRNIPLFSGLYVPDNGLEVVKDFAIEYELRGELEEESIKNILDFMNKVLMPSVTSGRSIIKAGRSYRLPYADIDIETMREEDVQSAELPEATIVGQINYVQWFSSMTVRGFGLRVVDVDFMKPDLPRESTVFVPLEAVDMSIAA